MNFWKGVTHEEVKALVRHFKRAAPEKCSSCGEPIEDHCDEMGRWQPCVEQVMDTVAAQEVGDA